MDELSLTRNWMKSSSPLLRFDAWFGQREELKLLNCLCTDAIDARMCHLKSKPALDSVMCLFI